MMQIDKICRACLREDVKMIDMYEKDIYQKFFLFANLTAEEIPDIPLNICRSCEQKLNISSMGFKEQCQKSHEILLNYIKNTREVKSKASDDDTSNVASETSAADADDKKASQIEKFPQSQVSEAINNLKQTFYKNKNCIRCNYVGNHSRALAQHMSRVHKDLKSSWCYVCNAEFDNLTDHVAANHSDYICKFCSRKFQKLGSLTGHLVNHSDVRKFQCSFCEKCFTKKYRFDEHLKKHTKEGESDAELVALKLKEHKRVHTNEAPHKCTYCNKKFKSHDNLVRHKRTHTGEKPHFCQVCERSFAQFDTLKGHMRIHNIGTKISCKICNKDFNRLYHLRTHLRSHTGEKPHVCTECGKGFVLNSYLVEHNKIHKNLRPYQCNNCDKSFRQKTGLIRHMLQHSGEKPYKCNQCSYACRHSSSLVNHMNKHVTDKPRADRPHVCLMCNHTFTTHAMLTCHINTHTVSFLEI